MRRTEVALMPTYRKNPDMTHTCHDCGYKEYHHTTKSGDVFHCNPSGFSFSDVPECVRRSCTHWVAVGEEDPEIKNCIGWVFKDADDLDEEKEDDADECASGPIQTSLEEWF